MHDFGYESLDFARRGYRRKILIGLLDLVCLEGEKWEEVGETCGRYFDVPLLHPEVELLEEHRVLLHVLVPMVRVSAVGVLGQNATHELAYAHMDEFGDFFDHDFSVYSVLCLVELILSSLLLSVEHDSSGVGKALPHAFFQFVMFGVRVTFMMLRAIFMFMLCFFLASFLASLEKFQEFHHGALDE